MKTLNFTLTILVLGIWLFSFSGCEKPPLGQKQPKIENGGRALSVSSHPTDDNIIVVASETGGLFRSTNAGTNWSQVSKDATFRFRDVMHLPTDGNIVLAAADVDTRVISGGGIYRSTDGGINWSKATMNAPSTSCSNTMGAQCLSFDASNGRLWTGTDCGLFYSDDQGANWTFLSGTSGLGGASIQAVATPAADKMVVLTDNTIRVSTNGGANWTAKSSGLPGNRSANEHNQIAVSSKNSQHIYFAFNYWKLNSANRWEGRKALYYSQNFGNDWSVIIDDGDVNRPVFIKLTDQALGGGNNKIDLYYGDGGGLLQRREVIHGPIHGFNPWQTLSMNHADPADLEIAKDGKTPILLVGDGGVMKTADLGASWTMAGTGALGYNALQITEVTGQRTTSDNKADLYFGTQDNHNWASADYGVTWPNKRCCEGFYLNVPLNNLPASETTHTGVACAGCGNYKSGPVLTSQSGWNNPPRNDGTPALIKPGTYVQKQFNLDSSAWQLARTTNTGSSWNSGLVSLNENVMNLPLVAGPAANPQIFLAISKSGTTNGAPNIGLKKVTGFLSSTIVQSELTGFGNIGTFPTMFAWYEVFGVKPSDPKHIIVPDIANDEVKVTKDGGLTWTNDTNLKNLVTNSGEFKFHWDRFSQISSFGWDPDCFGHIMVGTVQAGVFETYNNGNTWAKVAGSENIPYVSSFFFAKEGEVVISSYGRGLWRYTFECPTIYVLLPPEYVYRYPILWYLKEPIKLKEVILEKQCIDCGFYLLKGGNINDIELDEKTGEVKVIYIDGGKFIGYNQNGEEIDMPVKVTVGSGGKGVLSGDEELPNVLKNDKSVKGVFLKGTRYSGAIIHSQDLSPRDLPDQKPTPPKLRLNQSSDLGIPTEQVTDIIVIGSGFDPSQPINIFIDGQRSGLGDAVRFDNKGEFRIAIPPTFGLGNHTVLIRQETEKGLIEEMIDIRLTVQDYPEDDQK